MKLSDRLETLVRNACPGWHAAETIREAVELARSVEGAPVARVVGGRANSWGGYHVELAHNHGWHCGQRVRLVPEDGQGGVDHG